MNRKRAAVLLAAMLALFCAQGAAQETTPLAAKAQETAVQETRVRAAFGRKSYRGVTVSSKWLYQARFGNASFNMRMFTVDGEQITFKERLGAADSVKGGTRLTLRAGSDGGEQLLLQMDQEALSALQEFGITQIVVTDVNLYVLSQYEVSDLAAIREAYNLGEREMLCVSGEEDPVTVVSVDGVRRQITE